VGLGGTRERLLDAAEELIAERGPTRVTVRDITSLAGANTAAVNYHFGSKDRLLEALVGRGADLFGSRRSDLLAAADGSLDGVVRAIVRATADLVVDHDGGGRRWLRCKLQMRGSDAATALVHRAFGPYTEEVLTALAAVTPHLDDTTRAVRFALARDVIDTAFAGDHYPPAIGYRLDVDHDALVEHVVAFCVAAFAAPA
jgi:AcrR family transcriptional regulator